VKQGKRWGKTGCQGFCQDEGKSSSSVDHFSGFEKNEEGLGGVDGKGRDNVFHYRGKPSSEASRRGTGGWWWARSKRGAVG